MQEFEYRLEKEDYKNWIHWNVLKHESKKMKMVSALLYVAFLALFLGKNVMQAKGNLVLLGTVYRDSGAGRHRHVLHDFKPEPGADDLETERT